MDKKMKVEGSNANVMTLLEGGEEEFANLLKNSQKLIIIDFYATWCGPCKVIGPVFKTMADENADYIFVKVDVDEFEEIAEENDINCMPTFVFYKGGNKVDRFSGANVDKLKEKIKEVAEKHK